MADRTGNTPQPAAPGASPPQAGYDPENDLYEGAVSAQGTDAEGTEGAPEPASEPAAPGSEPGEKPTDGDVVPPEEGEEAPAPTEEEEAEPARPVAAVSVEDVKRF